MPTANRRTALITGASFGIGLELARIFAREGYNLVLVARSADKLLQLASEFEKAHGTRSADSGSRPERTWSSRVRAGSYQRAPTFKWMCWSTTRASDSMGCSPRTISKECPRQIQLNVTTLTLPRRA